MLSVIGIVFDEPLQVARALSKQTEVLIRSASKGRGQDGGTTGHGRATMRGLKPNEVVKDKPNSTFKECYVEHYWSQ